MIAHVFAPVAHAFPHLMEPPSEGLRKAELLASAAQRAQKEECCLSRRVVTTIQLSSALFSEFCLSGLGIFEEGSAAAVDVIEGRLDRFAGHIKVALWHIAHMVKLALYGTPLAALCFFAPDRVIAPFSTPLAAPGARVSMKMWPPLRQPPTTLQEAMCTLREAMPKLHGLAGVVTPLAHAFPRLMQPPGEGLRKAELLASAARYAQLEECDKNFFPLHVVTTIQFSSALLIEFCRSGLGVFEKSAEAVVDMLEGRLCQSTERMKTALRYIAHMVMLALYGTPLAALCFFAPDRMIHPFSPVGPKESPQPIRSIPTTPDSDTDGYLQEARRIFRGAASESGTSLNEEDGGVTGLRYFYDRLNHVLILKSGEINRLCYSYDTLEKRISILGNSIKRDQFMEYLHGSHTRLYESVYEMSVDVRNLTSMPDKMDNLSERVRDLECDLRELLRSGSETPLVDLFASLDRETELLPEPNRMLFFADPSRVARLLDPDEEADSSSDSIGEIRLLDPDEETDSSSDSIGEIRLLDPDEEADSSSD